MVRQHQRAAAKVARWPAARRDWEAAANLRFFRIHQPGGTILLASRLNRLGGALDNGQPPSD